MRSPVSGSESFESTPGAATLQRGAGVDVEAVVGGDRRMVLRDHDVDLGRRAPAAGVAHRVAEAVGSGLAGAGRVADLRAFDRCRAADRRGRDRHRRRVERSRPRRCRWRARRSATTLPGWSVAESAASVGDGTSLTVIVTVAGERRAEGVGRRERERVGADEAGISPVADGR